ncbi:SLC13 family permease [Arenimonas sp.]|uniref:SLC13 family permease n=1 Tax=Arenimonas sp. TaxID=1872635 RepID=UPI002E31CD62|nr:SLC13 family permease [Arenimonas sp.]HEX4852790.1 SLC13 family permease [Arenimonas sp.]
MTLRCVALVSGPAAALAAYFLLVNGGSAHALAATVGLTLWCALWWILEPVRGPVTALLPLAVLPLLGVLDAKQVAQSYGHELIMLLGGGFMLSRALERSGAHRRLALGMVRAFGGRSGRSLLYGFIAACGLISMWISNTATTLLMLPVALAVLEGYPDKRLHAPLILAIAYAASVGGLGTPIGSPPNLVFMQVYSEATGTRYGFLDWMAIGVPVVLVFLPLMALWLGRGLAGAPAAVLPDSGPWTPGERRVLVVFALTALAWIFRSEPFGGWSALLGLPGANDASVALLAVVALCVIPDGRGSQLLDWETAEKVPWGALVLFGGGIALAAAFQTSGLSAAVAESLSGLSALPLPLLLLGIVGGVVLLSEIASNTATAVLLMPILAATGVAVGVDPALFMFPAVLAASVGFMLPVATAPNAIAYGSGLVTSHDMLRHGAVLDLIGVAVLSAICYLAFA